MTAADLLRVRREDDRVRLPLLDGPIELVDEQVLRPEEHVLLAHDAVSAAISSRRVGIGSLCSFGIGGRRGMFTFAAKPENGEMVEVGREAEVARYPRRELIQVGMVQLRDIGAACAN